MTSTTETAPSYVSGPKRPTILRVACTTPADVLALPNGTTLRFRPMNSDDRDRLAALFARLTPESRRRRFLSPKPQLTPRELTFLTDIDHVRHEAIAAIDERDGSIVGIARYVRWAARPGVADVAIEVADEMQGMGIGRALATRLLQRARANGYTLLTATTLWENQPARALMRRFRFRVRDSHRSEIDLELELDPASGFGAPAYQNFRTRPRVCESTGR